MIINLQIYLLLLLKAIFNKILSNFPEIEKNVIAHGNPSNKLRNVKILQRKLKELLFY